MEHFNAATTPHKIQWLSDNGPTITAHNHRTFRVECGFEVCNTPSSSPESNDIVRDSVYLADLPDAEAALKLVQGLTRRRQPRTSSPQENRAALPSSISPLKRERQPRTREAKYGQNTIDHIVRRPHRRTRRGQDLRPLERGSTRTRFETSSTSSTSSARDAECRKNSGGSYFAQSPSKPSLCGDTGCRVRNRCARASACLVFPSPHRARIPKTSRSSRKMPSRNALS